MNTVNYKIKDAPNGDGLSFVLNDRDEIIVPDELLNDETFLKHFAEDFLSEPSRDDFEQLLKDCSIVFVVIDAEGNRTIFKSDE